MQMLNRREARHAIFAFKRKLDLEAEDVSYLNIVAMMDMMTILLVFLLKSWSVQVSNIQLSEVEPPRSSINLTVADALKVQITPTAIIVEGDAVVPVRRGAVDPSYKKTGANDYLIVPLEAVVTQHANREKKISQMRGEDWKGELSLIADKNTPYRLVTEVLYTVGQAGYKSYRLVTLKQSED
ncbi:MAG TPA: biopolymer transporter ExbD [Polyangia bacterium]|nr:biopolymer transporter ExbD [Polyangia bacterium]